MWTDPIRIWTRESWVTLMGVEFDLMMDGEKVEFAIHPGWYSEGLTITELSTGLALTTGIDDRFADFPEDLVRRAKDCVFELRCQHGNFHILEVIEHELIRRAQLDELKNIADEAKHLQSVYYDDDEIPF